MKAAVRQPEINTINTSQPVTPAVRIMLHQAGTLTIAEGAPAKPFPMSADGEPQWYRIYGSDDLTLREDAIPERTPREPPQIITLGRLSLRHVLTPSGIRERHRDRQARKESMLRNQDRYFPIYNGSSELRHPDVFVLPRYGHESTMGPHLPPRAERRRRVSLRHTQEVQPVKPDRIADNAMQLLVDTFGLTDTEGRSYNSTESRLPLAHETYAQAWSGKIHDSHNPWRGQISDGRINPADLPKLLLSLDKKLSRMQKDETQAATLDPHFVNQIHAAVLAYKKRFEIPKVQREKISLSEEATSAKHTGSVALKSVRFLIPGQIPGDDETITVVSSTNTTTPPRIARAMPSSPSPRQRTTQTSQPTRTETRPPKLLVTRLEPQESPQRRPAHSVGRLGGLARELLTSPIDDIVLVQPRTLHVPTAQPTPTLAPRHQSRSGRLRETAKVLLVPPK